MASSCISRFSLLLALLSLLAAAAPLCLGGHGSRRRHDRPRDLAPPLRAWAAVFALEGVVARLGGCAAQGAGVKGAQEISSTEGGLSASGVALEDFDYFGSSVASVGDVDGDNVTDICVGAFGDDDGGTGRGAVYMLFLNSDGTVKASQKVSSTQGGLTASGVSLEDGDLFGRSVASVGDLDGDLVTDICVGADRDDDGGTAGQSSDKGAVYMLFLNTNGRVKASQKISSTEGGLTASGVALEDRDYFGWSVASVGDFDGDAVTDICVGAIWDDDGCALNCNRGAVYMLFLNIDGTVKASQKISSTQGGPNASGVSLDNFDGFGSSVAPVGDFDGDNVTDICVGARRGDDDRGAVFMLFLNIDGTVKASQKISPTQGGLTASGVSLNDNGAFGSSVASVGDVDGDNVTDICVGATGDDDGGSARGALYVLFLNSNGTVKASQKISSTQGGLTASGVSLRNGDYFGSFVASLGDFDGDNVTDICVGAYGDADVGSSRGAVYVLRLITEFATVAIPAPNCSSALASFNETAFALEVAAFLPNVAPQDVRVLSVSCLGQQLLVTFTIVGGFPPSPTGSVSSTGITGTILQWPGFVTGMGSSTGPSAPESSKDPPSDSATSSGSGWLVGALVASILALLCTCVVVLGAVVWRRRRQNQLRSPDSVAMREMGASANRGSSAAADPPLGPLTLTELLGKGQYGRVFRGAAAAGGEPVAVKEVGLDGLSASELGEIEREGALLARCQHENIVQYRGLLRYEDLRVAGNASFDAPGAGALFMAMQLCEFCDLKACVHQAFGSRGERGIVLDAASVVEVARQIAAGMEYLAASEKICHRDLALRNVLVAKAASSPGGGEGGHGQTRMADGTPVACLISDFGLSRVFNGDYHAAYYSANEGALPIRWLSPEAILRGRYGAESDVYAFGVTMLELLHGNRQLFGRMPNAEIVDYFHAAGRNADSEQVPDFVLESLPSLSTGPGATPGVPVELWSLIQRCCRFGHKARPGFAEIVAAVSAVSFNAGGALAVAEGASPSTQQPPPAVNHASEDYAVGTLGDGGGAKPLVFAADYGSANASQNALQQPFDDHAYGTLEDAEIRGRRGQ